MAITKVAQNAENLRRPSLLFSNARSAFKAFLQSLPFSDGQSVLLPAYVGWSPREGSGVFDPVAELGLPFAFYRLDDRLQLDLDHLAEILETQSVRVLVLIHFFGYVDPHYREAVALARQHGVWVLEDEAHALYTDLIGGLCGRLGDACIYSLHKMLPVAGGGMAISNDPVANLLQGVTPSPVDVPPLWDFDLLEIARCRSRNAQLLTELLQPLSDEVEPLRGNARPGEIPQTYPVLIRRVSRDRLYSVMNEAGFGVVSLYHTLIEQISPVLFPASHRLSRRIMNLPVHQDIQRDDLLAMVAHLARTLPDMPDA